MLLRIKAQAGKPTSGYQRARFSAALVVSYLASARSGAAVVASDGGFVIGARNFHTEENQHCLFREKKNIRSE